MTRRASRTKLEAALKREIEQIGADRRKLNQDLIDTAGRIRGVEAQVTATGKRASSRSTPTSKAFASRSTAAAP